MQKEKLKYSTEEILNAFRSDDQKMITYVYNFLYRNWIHNLSFNNDLIYDEVCEIFQKAFIAMHKTFKKEDFKLVCRVDVFFYSVINNTKLRFFEHKKDSKKVKIDDMIINQLVHTEDHSPMYANFNLIIEELGNIKPIEKNVVYQTIFNDKTHDDLHIETGKTKNTIKTEKNKTLTKLKEVIKTKYKKEIFYEL